VIGVSPPLLPGFICALLAWIPCVGALSGVAGLMLVLPLLGGG